MVEKHLLLYAKAPDFVMIHKIKIDAFPNLFTKIFIACNLENTNKHTYLN